MSPHEQPRHDSILTELRNREANFRRWLGTLREADPVFAQASVLEADSWGEWQAAVYLLAGCHTAWATLGAEILATRSISPVIDELERGRRGWSSSEHMLLRWAAHFWDVGHSELNFPHSFDEHYFRRWVTACHLYKHIPPQTTATTGDAP